MQTECFLPQNEACTCWFSARRSSSELKLPHSKLEAAEIRLFLFLHCGPKRTIMVGWPLESKSCTYNSLLWRPINFFFGYLKAINAAVRFADTITLSFVYIEAVLEPGETRRFLLQILNGRSFSPIAPLERIGRWVFICGEEKGQLWGPAIASGHRLAGYAANYALEKGEHFKSTVTSIEWHW